MTIQPSVFDFIFYFVILGVGLDFAMSGVLMLKGKTKFLEKPKLLGLFMIRIVHVSSKTEDQNKLVMAMFALKSLGVYSLGTGILFFLGGLIGLFGIFY